MRAGAVDPAFEHIHEPGGFRRNYVLLKASEQGIEQPQIASNFVDFLYLFGHFVSACFEFMPCAVCDLSLIITRLVKT